MNRFNQNKKPSLLPNLFLQFALSECKKTLIGFKEQLDSYTLLVLIPFRVTASALVPAFLHRLAISAPMVTTTTNYMDCLFQALTFPFTHSKQENPLPFILSDQDNSCYSFSSMPLEEAMPA